MKKSRLFALGLVLAVVSAANASAATISPDISVNSPLLPSTLLLSHRVMLGSTDSIQLLAFDLTGPQNIALDKAMRWSRISMIALGTNVLAGAIAIAGAEFVGAIGGVLTLGFWTLSNGMMAFGHRDIYFDLRMPPSEVPLNTIPFFSSVGAASFGMGAMTALSMVFTDTTGVAGVLAGVCGGISWISGIVAIITTRRYERTVRG